MIWASGTHYQSNNMTVDIAAAIIGFVTGLGGLGVAVYTAAKSAKKTEVETLRIIIETQAQQISKMQSRIAELETENEELKAQLKKRKGWDV